MGIYIYIYVPIEIYVIINFNGKDLEQGRLGTKKNIPQERK